MRAAIYGRVSTTDQHVENQLAELRQYVERRGWTATEFVDVGVSGAKDRRPALDELLKAARRRRFDVLVCWRLDRLGRNLRHLILLLDELQALGVVRLLRALSGLAQGEPELSTLSGIDGSPLAATLSTARIEELADIVAAGRAISTETARMLLNASGGPERALTMLEANTPWCRNLKVGRPTPELLDGREVTGPRPDSLVARVEYRYVSDTLQPDIHDATVALATTISRLHPDVDLVRAVALDARNRPYGYRGIEVASKWVERKSLPGEEQVAWNITRSQLVISMLTAESRTDEIAAEMKLLEQSVACLTTFAEAWLKDGGPGRLALQAVNTQRSSLIRAIDEIVTSDDSGDSSRAVKFVPLTPILRDCIEDVIARLSNDTEHFRAVDGAPEIGPREGESRVPKAQPPTHPSNPPRLRLDPIMLSPASATSPHWPFSICAPRVRVWTGCWSDRSTAAPRFC